jgi:hypothetical protein
MTKIIVGNQIASVVTLLRNDATYLSLRYAKRGEAKTTNQRERGNLIFFTVGN